MANAVTRAHVCGPQPIAADPCRKSSVEAVQPFEDEANEPTTGIISRKDRRKQKKQGSFPESSAQSKDDVQPPRAPPNNPPRNKQRAPQPSLDPQIYPMHAARNAAQKTYSLLVCSLGNPGPKHANTLHSAGHTVTSHIAAVKNFRPFQKELWGLVSRPNSQNYSFGLLQGFKKEQFNGPPTDGDDWIFWQSTSLMNLSGQNIKKAWQKWSRDVEKDGLHPRLVVVHDELESPLGKVTIKEGAASPRGHNGLKSCQTNLGNTKWWRVGVGIGRPESREPAVVANYVLRKMTRSELGAVEKASSGVVDALRQISEGVR